ncbi:MAG: hypothetical protein DSO04_03205, partial [Hadesarchaea archaeon]
MLFDDRPKEDRKALFDREKEVNELKKSLKHPITVVTGIRRIGKTSVLKVSLKEIGRESLLLGCQRAWAQLRQEGILQPARELPPTLPP